MEVLMKTSDSSNSLLDQLQSVLDQGMDRLDTEQQDARTMILNKLQ